MSESLKLIELALSLEDDPSCYLKIEREINPAILPEDPNINRTTISVQKSYEDKLAGIGFDITINHAIDEDEERITAYAHMSLPVDEDIYSSVNYEITNGVITRHSSLRSKSFKGDTYNGIYYGDYEETTRKANKYSVRALARLAVLTAKQKKT